MIHILKHSINTTNKDKIRIMNKTNLLAYLGRGVNKFRDKGKVCQLLEGLEEGLTGFVANQIDRRTLLLTCCCSLSKAIQLIIQSNKTN